MENKVTVVITARLDASTICCQLGDLLGEISEELVEARNGIWELAKKYDDIEDGVPEEHQCC